ncbi:uncharacterized protein LOC105309855 [Pteropus vampyrus]|uniref:Uncharacterized protein LOC105309855 n=1 Tax=Pteropus vampyrus TaxID=132908 RepID=A0A6P3RNT3_PTEVA|nr:uncharacterized protein LOC105309855 [Pteropus vampyrus]
MEEEEGISERENSGCKCQEPESIIIPGRPNQGWKDWLSLDCEMLRQRILLSSAALSPSHSELHAPPCPTRKLLFKGISPGPEKPGVLCIRRRTSALFYPREQNCHFRKESKLLERSGVAREHHRGRRGEESGRRTAGPAPRAGPAPAPPAPPRPATPALRATSAHGPHPHSLPVWLLRGAGGARGGVHGEGDAERARVRGRTGLVGATATCLGTHEAVAPALRTMGLGSRGSLALFIVGALLVLALLKAAVDSADTEGSSNGNLSTVLKTSTIEPAGEF